MKLGEKSKKFHKEVISTAIKSSINLIIFCGDMYKEAIIQQNLKLQKVFYFDDELKILNFLNKNILKNDIILAKGSNSSRVNKLVNLLLETKRKNNC